MSMINRTRVPKPKKFDQSARIFYTIALFILSFGICNHYNQLELSHHLAFHNRRPSLTAHTVPFMFLYKDIVLSPAAKLSLPIWTTMYKFSEYFLDILW